MLIQVARSGKDSVQLAAIREIADRTEGKPRQSVELDARLSASIAERLEEARKRKVSASSQGIRKRGNPKQIRIALSPPERFGRIS